MLGETLEAPVVDDVEARRRRNGRVEALQSPVALSIGCFTELTNGSAGDEIGCRLLP